MIAASSPDDKRRRSRSIEEYLNLCDNAHRRRVDPPQPDTIAEAVAYADRWPERAHLVRPADPIWFQMAGVSARTARTIPTFSREWLEQFLATLEAYPTLTRALVVILRGAASGQTGGSRNGSV
jgi:hypothetical protein